MRTTFGLRLIDDQPLSQASSSSLLTWQDLYAAPWAIGVPAAGGYGLCSEEECRDHWLLREGSSTTLIRESPGSSPTEMCGDQKQAWKYNPPGRISDARLHASPSVLVLMESLSSSAGVVDVMNIRRGERVTSRMSTMLGSGWIRGKALGTGTSATAYLAQRGADGFVFVVKEVPLSGKGLLWKDLPRDLRNEAVVLSRARHISGVVEFFGCEVIADKFCLYMEYLGGGTLASLAPASPSKRLPEAQASGYLRKILRTLRSLHHGAGGLMGSRDSGAVLEDTGELITPIMHRDVKARRRGSNCLLSSDRKTVKLCDFGSCTRPRPLSFQGTPLAADGKRLDESIDLTSDIPPDCTAIVDEKQQQVIGFAPRSSTFSELHDEVHMDQCDEPSVDLLDSMAESGGHHKSSAERRYENPQFFFKSMKGTLRWMAPETLGGHDYSAKVDVWSVGCLLIEMVCGQDPWKEFDNEIQAMHEIWTARDKTPIDYIKPEIWSQCSEECRDFMRKTVQRDPHARPTCAELLQHPFIRGKR
ncbi:hypothetical protein FOL47_010130 [Perkinsus chesapeaki]|uniref:Protein kinase domain-containing protein n=1 Tax=Perkinsus chesapeaki TaxID=330153 RepID=A0A7J6MR70_PERCH|nr:hypothetical protein FOL47_010130 [Perkinsus chesapeaki]